MQTDSTAHRFEPLEHRPLSEIVLEEVRRSIVNGKLSPGTRLLESELADQLQVSRVTVRLALQRLQLEGLVDVRPRRGAVVARISEEMAHDVWQVRAALEGFAARSTCRTLTEAQIDVLRDLAQEMGECVRRGDIMALAEADIAFHSIIFEGISNARLLSQWAVSNALHGALMAAVLASYPYDPHQVTELHLRVIDAMSTRDPECAERGIREHYLGEVWDAVPNEDVSASPEGAPSTR
jgi:DNA-binding GntR family transcriptional regulator